MFMNLFFRCLTMLVVLMLVSGCFRRFRMTEADLNKYYQTHAPRPESREQIDGKHRIHWVQSGSDTLPLLLLVHGAPGSWYGYINFLSDSTLLQHFALASVDRPGYNKSRPGGKVLSIARQAELISLIFRGDSTRPVYLMGRSYGAPIAAYLAAKFPNQVKGLMLIAPAASPDHEKFWWFSPILKYPPIRWLFPSPIKTASDEKYAHRRELRKMLPYWSQIKCPTHILQGKSDFIVKPINAQFVDSLLVSAPHKLTFLDETGHLITREKPWLVKEKMLQLKYNHLLN